jgi:hypothetical protein
VVDHSGASWWVDGRLLTGGAPTAPTAPRSAASGKWLIGAVGIAVVVVGVFLLTRDGDGGTVAIDDLSAEEQAVAGSLSEAIVTSEGLGEMGGLGAGAGPVLDPEAIDCISAGVVRDVGTERLAELGVTAEGATGGGEALTQLTVEEREQVADRILGCVDVEQVISDGLEAQGLDPAIGGCLIDKLGEGTIRDMLVVGLSGEEVDLESDPEMGEALMVAFFTCMPDDIDLGDLGDLGG